MTATCYKCGKEYPVKCTTEAEKEAIDSLLLDKNFDPTEWECPECLAAEAQQDDSIAEAATEKALLNVYPEPKGYIPELPDNGHLKGMKKYSLILFFNNFTLILKDVVFHFYSYQEQPKEYTLTTYTNDSKCKDHKFYDAPERIREIK